MIFRDGKAKADQIIPFSQYDSEDPEDLWKWMAETEQKTGGRVLAIPHNGNLSSGLMFDDVTLTTKKPLDRDYAQRRMRWEPIYEVTQMKGDGETHPALSPNDEFANFETWDKGSFGGDVHTPAMLPREYAREALKRGLKLRAKLGANPFKFGIVGSTDSHTGAVDHHGRQLLRQGHAARAFRETRALRRDHHRPAYGGYGAPAIRAG